MEVKAKLRKRGDLAHFTRGECTSVNKSKRESVGRAPQQRTGPDDIMVWVEKEMVESLRVQQAFIKECAGTLSAICAGLAERLEQGGKLLLFGNGGSAADAQHIAAEFVGRYQLERAALPAMALTVN